MTRTIRTLGKARKTGESRKVGRVGALLMASMLAALTLGGCSAPAGASGAENAAGGASGGATENIVLRCGVKQSHAPFSYTDDDGSLVGLEEDVVAEAFGRIDGYDVEIVGFDASPALFAALQAGNIHFGSGQYVASATRKETYKFPKQYYALSPMYLASRSADDFQALKDIAGETLEFASTSYEKEIIDAYNKENPGFEIKIVDASGDLTTADQLQQILTKQRNVLLLYKSSYDTVQEELKLDGLTLSAEPVIVEDVYQVFHKDVPDDFIQKFDDALKSMLDDGTLGKIAQKWCGEDTIAQYKDKIIPVE
ncbi:MAG: transporter substrate-binding domain-containing protein [Clostridiales bacterium]|jgi:ABC-type amino acid transport substrate-binding protein|nr:transporter substrate-binding domain-containing protein [Clostridiales bacterium]